MSVYHHAQLSLFYLITRQQECFPRLFLCNVCSVKISGVVHCSLRLVFQLAFLLVSFLSLSQMKLMLFYVLEVALCGSSVLLLWPVMRLHISARGKQGRGGGWGPMTYWRSSVILRTSCHCCPWCYHKHTAGDQVFNTQPLGGLTQTTEAVLKTWRDVRIGGRIWFKARETAWWLMSVCYSPKGLEVSP